MLYQRIRKFWNNIFQNERKMILLPLILLLVCSGCEQDTGEEKTEQGKKEQQISEKSESLAEGYREIYETAVEQGNIDTLEVQEKIIDVIGKSGYAAVDRDNQLNMVNYEQAEEFCENAGEKRKDHVTIICLIEQGGLVRYDMETENGEIDVTVCTVKWEENSPEVTYYHQFTAYSWRYTEKGYFFIEEYQPPGYDSAPGVRAFRIKPLPEEFRKLNRKYVRPIGYEGNNLLSGNWSEKDYSELDFYDLYEHFYYQEYGEIVPYERGEGAEYQIPAEEFENVIIPHFQISREKLREYTTYDSGTQTYRYRPRGMNDGNLPYGPYPEVVGFEEQDDGTIRLSVEAVWERKMIDCAVSSELVVRPLEDGGFQYVSDQVTGWDENLEMSWYTPRLTDEEWRDYYK